MLSLIGFGFLLIILLFTGALLGIAAYFRSKNLQKDVWEIKQKLHQLQALATHKEKPDVKKADTIAASTSAPLLTKDVPFKKVDSVEEKKVVPEKEEKTIPVLKTEETDKHIKENKTAPIVEEIRPKRKQNEFLKKLEKHFLENWTGIIGAIVTVIGIGFLGTFTALKLSEMYRFFMIVLVSLILLVLYFILRFSKKWLKLGLWLRSMAAALFLVACAGAGGIPGLRWIEDPLIGLVVLCLGIAANILLAILGKKQLIASIHLLLSLAALSIAPQNQVIFIIATIVTLSGILLTFREKWEYHLLLSTTLYCIYIIFYFFKVDILSLHMQITGIISISGISILSLFVHYRKIYSNPEFDVKPFFTHILTWIYFGIGVFLYSPRVYWISIPLGAGACLCFILAHRARALKIRWLFNTDILMAQVIAVIAVITLLEWNVSYYPIVSILFIESLVFSIIVLIEGEYILLHFGQWFFFFFSLLFGMLSFINLASTEPGVLFRNAILVSLCIIVAVMYHIFSNLNITMKITEKRITGSNKRWCSAYNILCGIVVGLLFLPLYVNLRHRLPWTPFFDAEYVLLIPFFLLILLREKIQSHGLGISVLVTLLIMHICVWLDPLLAGNSLWYEKLIYVLPLFILDSACIIFTFVKSLSRHIKWPGIYLFSAHLFVVTYFLFNPISPLIPGVLWLILSVIMLGLSRLFRKHYGDEVVGKGSPDKHFLHIGYVCIGAFLLRHILVHLQSVQEIWFIKARLLIEILALVVFLFWALSKKPEGEKVSKSYTFLHPLFPELICLFSILVIAVELNKIYQPIAWIIFSIISLFLGMISKHVLSRFRFHSLFFYWLSVIHVVFLTSPLVTPSFRFLDRIWIFSCITFILQFGYIVFFHKKGDIDSVTLPQPLTWLKRFVKIVGKRINLWVYYPLFITIALFLIWSFDKSILTLLLFAECFLIFVISIIIRESHFRYVSLAGLGACMVRLVFYDLASSNVLTKAIVCIGVGLLLIGMNALYNKFSGRYKK